MNSSNSEEHLREARERLQQSILRSMPLLERLDPQSKEELQALLGQCQVYQSALESQNAALMAAQRLSERTQTQVFEQRHHDLKRLSFAMAHHFQEPARRLVVLSKVLNGRLGIQLRDEEKKLLEFIELQSRRLSDLVRAMLDFLPYELEGQVAYSGPSVDGVQILQQVIDAFLQQQGQEWRACIRLPEGVHCQVAMPEKELAWIYQIALSNAYQHRHPQRPWQLQLTLDSQHDGFLQCRFIDNGQGIPEVAREEVFELFMRLSSAALPGLGMGLPQLRRLVQRHAGKAWFEDGQEGGVTLVLTLPGEVTLC